MPRITFAIAAVVALSINAPARATVTTTTYSVSSNAASGTFALDFDSSTSTYSLSALNLLLGSVFTPSNSSLQPVGSGLEIGGNLNGVDTLFVNTPDFLLAFDPSLASQSALFDYSLAGFPSLQLGDAATVDQLGSSGAITTYSVTSNAASGTFALDFDASTSTYSLSALNLLLGSVFTPSNSSLQPVGSGLEIGGNLNGVDTLFVNTPDFLLAFDPSLASQSALFDYSLAGFPSLQLGDAATVNQVAPSAVPEPPTWALMLIGVGAAGVAARRSRRRRILRGRIA